MSRDLLPRPTRLARVAVAATMLGACTDREPDSPFRYDAARAAEGTLLRYAKSNLDGSHASRIAVYIAAPERIESFKWSPGSREAVLVAATMDWSRVSARRLESWRIDAEGGRMLQATLDIVGDSPRYVMALGGAVVDTAVVEHWPWHSYDFDFASLGLAMRHLVDPERAFTIGVADVAVVDGAPRFVDKGTVTVTPEAVETRAGWEARRYRIDGPGLQHRGGVLWIATEGGHLVGYEIDLPDEEGMTSGKLALQDVGRLTAEEWAAFQLAQLSEAPATP